MTPIEQKALALLNEVAKEMELSRYASLDHNLPGHRALYRAIEQHEQFKRQVSDAVELARAGTVECGHSETWWALEPLDHFILPEPVDPLVEALRDTFDANDGYEDASDLLRAALAKRGGHVVWENEP